MDCEQIIQISQNSKSWTDYLSALLVPIIAIVGMIIALLQWKTNANRLKHELFDRRYEKFDAVRKFLVSILSYDEVKTDAEMRFLSSTKGVRFIFDEEIAKYIDKIWRLSVELTKCNDGLKGMSQGNKEDRDKIMREKHEIKDQLRKNSKKIEQTFDKYLQLK